MAAQGSGNHMRRSGASRRTGVGHPHDGARLCVIPLLRSCHHASPAPTIRCRQNAHPQECDSDIDIPYNSLVMGIDKDLQSALSSAGRPARMAKTVVGDAANLLLVASVSLPCGVKIATRGESS